jgi:hypothetical protein
MRMILSAGVAGLVMAAAAAAARGAEAETQPADMSRQVDAARGATLVYRSHLPRTPGEEWSLPFVDRTPTGDRPFIGPVQKSEPLTLTLEKLPAHAGVRVVFDLYLFRSWDGSSPTWGYSKWDLGLDDGRSLIRTTFANCGFFMDNNEQAFPDSWPARVHPAWTLATEHQTLGTTQDWGDGPQDCSSVYHFDLTFPHSSERIVFSFVSALEKSNSKYFGLTNVSVETLDRLPTATAEELARWWKDLGSEEPAIFFAAQWKLVATGDVAAAYIAQHQDETIDMPEKEIAALIGALGGDKGAEAEARLTFQGRHAIAAVKAALQDPATGEGAKAALARIAAMEARFPETPTQLRLYRAKQALAAIHTPAATKVEAKLPELPERDADGHSTRPEAANSM